MKLQYIILLGSILALEGCGGGTSSGTTVDNTTNSSDTSSMQILKDLKSLVKKTGQTEEYVSYDDGYYQKGKSAEYSRDDTTNIVTDQITGLMWQDKDLGYKVLVSEDNVENGNTSDMSGDTANTFCMNLDFGGYTDWRLPTLLEVESIMENTDTGLNNIFEEQSRSLWTISPAIERKGMFWYAEMDKNVHNRWFGDDEKGVRCVRGSSNLEDTGDYYNRLSSGIVVDLNSGLEWQDDYSDNNNEVKTANWEDAISYCENLVLGDNSDWRLPNKNELLSIVDHRRYSPAINQKFINTKYPVYYWTSTSQDNSNAIAIEFEEGSSYTWEKDDDAAKYLNVRCVRGTEK